MKNITPIQWIIFGLLSIMIIILPFLVSSSLLFPFITGKNFLFRIIIEICFGLWVIDCLKNREMRPRKSLLILAIVGFVAIIGLADLLGVDPYRSFWSNFERMEGWITLIHLLAFFLVLAHSLTERLWYKLVQISLGTSFLVGLHALTQLSETSRVSGNLGNSTYLGAYAMLHVFFALIFLLRHIYEQKKGDFFGFKVFSYGALVIFNTLILYFTGTRSAFLGLVGGIVITALTYIFTEREHKALRNVSIGILGLVVAIVLVLGLVKNTEFAKKHNIIARFGALVTLDIKSYAETEGRARFMVWGMALRGVKERPFLGWGQENFPYVFSKYYNPGMFEQEQWFDRTHDVFFDWLISGGVLGLLSYLFMFASALILVWSKANTISGVEKGIIMGIIFAYFVHNIFVFDNLTSWIPMFIILAFAHIKNSREIGIFSGKISDNSRYVISTVIGFIVIYSIFALNYSQYKTGSDIIMGISYARAASDTDKDKELYIKKSYEYFKSSIDRDTFGKRESGEQLSNISTQVAKGNIGATTTNNFTELSVGRLKEEAEREPLDARANLFYGIHLLSLGRPTDAVVYLKKAHELSPAKQTILFSLANAYSVLKDNKSSENYLKQAYELDKSFAEPAILYATSLINSGKTTEAFEIIKTVPDEKLIDQKYVEFLVKIKRFDLIVKIFENLLVNNPNKPQLKISLAAAYLQNGQRNEAISTIEDVANSVPEFRKQADYLIGEIKAGRNPIDK